MNRSSAASAPSIREEPQRLEDDLDLALAVASHEFRSPLVAAELALESILAEADLAPKERRLLSKASMEVRDVAREMDGMLSWAAGRRRPSRRLLDLHRLATQVAHECVRLAGGGRIEVKGKRTLIRGDRGLLRLALRNLMRNALAYGGDEPSVLVGVLRFPHVASITIRDRGPGVPQAEVTSIFDPFMRGVSGSRVHGAGLGLYIARRIVQDHGGQLHATAGRTGGAFRVRLPVEEVV
ncbi:MAG: HAMP domain-containing histidine kinase [Actinomycetota bacterium]|nr:HAMP domain-containing histidine kinase [Actinomycetota bacterium]